MIALDSLRFLSEGRTGDMLKKEFGGMSQFSRVKDWDKFGEDVKSLYMHVSLFSGAAGAFIRFMSRGGKLPATTRSLAEQGLKAGSYDAEKTAGILSGDDILELQQVTGKKLAKMNIKKVVADQEVDDNEKVSVWSFGEKASEFAKVLAKHGVSLR